MFYAALGVVAVLLMAWIEPLVAAAGLAISALLITADLRYVRGGARRPADPRRKARHRLPGAAGPRRLSLPHKSAS
jgi:hypothetical protein